MKQFDMRDFYDQWGANLGLFLAGVGSAIGGASILSKALKPTRINLAKPINKQTMKGIKTLTKNPKLFKLSAIREEYGYSMLFGPLPQTQPSSSVLKWIQSARDSLTNASNADANATIFPFIVNKPSKTKSKRRVQRTSKKVNKTVTTSEQVAQKAQEAAEQATAKVNQAAKQATKKATQATKQATKKLTKTVNETVKKVKKGLDKITQNAPKIDIEQTLKGLNRDIERIVKEVASSPNLIRLSTSNPKSKSKLLPLALSLLIGGGLGGVGMYLYRKAQERKKFDELLNVVISSMNNSKKRTNKR